MCDSGEQEHIRTRQEGLVQECCEDACRASQVWSWQEELRLYIITIIYIIHVLFLVDQFQICCGIDFFVVLFVFNFFLINVNIRVRYSNMIQSKKQLRIYYIDKKIWWFIDAFFLLIEGLLLEKKKVTYTGPG